MWSQINFPGLLPFIGMRVSLLLLSLFPPWSSSCEFSLFPSSALGLPALRGCSFKETCYHPGPQGPLLLWSPSLLRSVCWEHLYISTCISLLSPARLWDPSRQDPGSMVLWKDHVSGSQTWDLRWSWVSHLTSLRLSILICEMERIHESSAQGFGEDTFHKAFREVPCPLEVLKNCLYMLTVAYWVTLQQCCFPSLFISLYLRLSLLLFCFAFEPGKLYQVWGVTFFSRRQIWGYCLQSSITAGGTEGDFMHC